MCLAVVAINAHPRYALVVAANRDEFHARPTAPAHWWQDRRSRDLLAGRDLQAGGTWLGVTRRGRWAFVTNVREPGRRDVAAPSRGGLVVRVLDDPRDPATALADALTDTRYNGYNLIAGDLARAAWISNRSPESRTLAPGVHGVSNAQLDTPWPKLERVKAGVAAWTRAGHQDVAPLLELLVDRVATPDSALPKTGVPIEWERLLSSPFIVSPAYGTRSSTVLAVAHDGAAIFHERSFDASGRATGDVIERFATASR
ncbi:MAG TPA: NRDE family protein [Casimicrobiaceae bacterium]|nr:NRDE family protein [Casimicrobiaceae bacterium]